MTKTSEACNFSDIPFYEQGLLNYLFMVTFVPSQCIVRICICDQVTLHLGQQGALTGGSREEKMASVFLMKIQKDEDRA